MSAYFFQGGLLPDVAVRTYWIRLWLQAPRFQQLDPAKVHLLPTYMVSMSEQGVLLVPFFQGPGWQRHSSTCASKFSAAGGRKHGNSWHSYAHILLDRANQWSLLTSKGWGISHSHVPPWRRLAGFVTSPITSVLLFIFFWTLAPYNILLHLPLCFGLIFSTQQ